MYMYMYGNVRTGDWEYFCTVLLIVNPFTFHTVLGNPLPIPREEYYHTTGCMLFFITLGSQFTRTQCGEDQFASAECSMLDKTSLVPASKESGEKLTDVINRERSSCDDVTKDDIESVKIGSTNDDTCNLSCSEGNTEVLGFDKSWFQFKGVLRETSHSFPLPK